MWGFGIGDWGDTLNGDRETRTTTLNLAILCRLDTDWRYSGGNGRCVKVAWLWLGWVFTGFGS